MKHEPFGGALFGMICVGVVVANGAIFKARARGYASDDPALLQDAYGIANAFRYWLGGLTLLWTIGMAVGISTFDPLEPESSLSWFDILMFVLDIVMFARASWWVYFQGGADRLLEHRRMFRLPNSKVLILFLWTVIVTVIGYSVVTELVPRLPAG